MSKQTQYTKKAALILGTLINQAIESLEGSYSQSQGRYRADSDGTIITVEAIVKPVRYGYEIIVNLMSSDDWIVVDGFDSAVMSLAAGL